MYIVYALYSQRYNKIYIGYTSNLEQRILSHNKLATKGYTIKYRPWKIVYQEEIATKSLAIIREKQLKSAAGRKMIWEIINNDKSK